MVLSLPVTVVSSRKPASGAVCRFKPGGAGPNSDSLAAWCCWIPSCRCREQRRSGCVVLLDSFLSLPGTAKVWLRGVSGFLSVAAGAVPDLLSVEGGSLAGGDKNSECGRQKQAGG